jgi:hypothetical protein
MASPMYVKWLLLNPDKIDYAKEKYPYFTRFVKKYIKEKHSQWFNSLMNNECYFCGATFQNLYMLKLHLARTKCALSFDLMIHNILHEWDKFNGLCERLKYRKRKDVKQILLKLLEDPSVKLENVYRFCRENS